MTKQGLHYSCHSDSSDLTFKNTREIKSPNTSKVSHNLLFKLTSSYKNRLGEMQNTLADHTNSNNTIEYFFKDIQTNRKELFKEALSSARDGKVLYILHEEFTELPELSQDLASVNRHYMKMISFLYAKSLAALIEIISTLSDWQNIPFTIIVENLNDYCPKDKLQNACGVVALLIDSVQRCSKALGVPCKLLISIDKDIGDEYCNLLKELYCQI